MSRAQYGKLGGAVDYIPDAEPIGTDKPATKLAVRVKPHIFMLYTDILLMQGVRTILDTLSGTPS
jgi:hypothetical protein